MRTACLLARASHQVQWAKAFGDGLVRHGWQVTIAADRVPADLMVTWGVRRVLDIEAQRRDRGEICILERGYLGDRFAWTSVSFGGGLNGRAEFRGLSSDPARFETHFPGLLQPWRVAEDGLTLLIGQVPRDMSLNAVGGSLARWYRETAAELVARGHEVVYRPHPQALRRGMGAGPSGIPVDGGTLADALASAQHVVTFNSNAAVDAVLAGVPATVCDVGSMAWPVASHGIDEPPVRPDRGRWAAELAWKQWTAEEMRSGDCWDRVGR